MVFEFAFARAVCLKNHWTCSQREWYRKCLISARQWHMTESIFFFFFEVFFLNRIQTNVLEPWCRWIMVSQMTLTRFVWIYQKMVWFNMIDMNVKALSVCAYLLGQFRCCCVILFILLFCFVLRYRIQYSYIGYISMCPPLNEWLSVKYAPCFAYSWEIQHKLISSYVKVCVDCVCV